MDLFALILVTITAITICGICLFIFVCAIQPRFLRKLHGKPTRIYEDSESNDEEISIKSVDLPMESRTSIPEDVSNNRDKIAYLKSLERSLRTGRPIQDNDTYSHSTPWKFIRHYFNKYIRRKPSDTFIDTEI